jgi:hypothetical protein
LNLTANSGSGSLGMQGQNRLMTGVLPQGLCARKKLISASVEHTIYCCLG